MYLLAMRLEMTTQQPKDTVERDCTVYVVTAMCNNIMHRIVLEIQNSNTVFHIVMIQISYTYTQNSGGQRKKC